MGKTALLDSLNTALNAFIDSTEELRAEDAKTSHIVQFSPSVFTLQKSTSGISAFSDEEASKISKDARVLADALIRTSKGGYKRVPGNPSALWCSSYDRAQNFVSRLNVLLEKTNEGAPRFETGHSIGVATSKIQIGRAALSNIDTTSSAQARAISMLKKEADIAIIRLQVIDSKGVFYRKVSSKGDIEAEVTYTFPELAVHNQDKGKLARSRTITLRALAKAMKSGKHPKIHKLRGSKSILTASKDLIVATLKKGRGKTYSKTTSVSKRKRNRSVTRTKSSSLQLRNLRGQFTSAMNIQSILNANITQKVEDNMGSPALNYRTGRFAESVKITSVSQSRAGLISIFYTYMKYPYQTFEPGYLQGSTSRNPKTLIARSIRDIATTLVANKLRVIGV